MTQHAADLIGIDEVRERLPGHPSRKAIYRRIERGTLPEPIIIARRFYWRPDAIARVLEGGDRAAA